MFTLGRLSSEPLRVGDDDVPDGHGNHLFYPTPFPIERLLRPGSDFDAQTIPGLSYGKGVARNCLWVIQTGCYEGLDRRFTGGQTWPYASPVSVPDSYRCLKILRMVCFCLQNEALQISVFGVMCLAASDFSRTRQTGA